MSNYAIIMLMTNGGVMMKCSKCGTENPSSALYCSQCGANLAGGDNDDSKRYTPYGQRRDENFTETIMSFIEKSYEIVAPLHVKIVNYRYSIPIMMGIILLFTLLPFSALSIVGGSIFGGPMAFGSLLITAIIIFLNFITALLPISIGIKRTNNIVPGRLITINVLIIMVISTLLSGKGTFNLMRSFNFFSPISGIITLILTLYVVLVLFLPFIREDSIKQFSIVYIVTKLIISAIGLLLIFIISMSAFNVFNSFHFF